MSSHRSTGAPAPANPASIASCFHVGTHVVRVFKVMEGRWTMTVDDAPGASSYATQADAWEAGVREADRIDRAAQAAAH
jgi:hypothetical protein